MKARVVIGGQESDPFQILASVKQGCVLAPVTFDLFLVAVTLVFWTGLSTDGIPFKYRLDGSIFNLRRLQAHTKVSTDTVYELQYADDAALPSHSPSGVQDGLNTLMASYHMQSRLDHKYQENRFCNHHLPRSSHSQYMAIRST